MYVDISLNGFKVNLWNRKAKLEHKMWDSVVHRRGEAHKHRRVPRDGITFRYKFYPQPGRNTILLAILSYKKPFVFTVSDRCFRSEGQPVTLDIKKVFL